MQIFYDPIKGLSASPPPPGIRLAQGFANVLIADQDTWYGNILVKKGENVYKRLTGQDGHNGWDIAAPLGTPIYAPADGWIIEQTAKDTGFGLRVGLRHEVGGEYFLTVYGHMQRLELPENIAYNWNHKGYPVQAGQVIGYVDSTGWSTGHHLHWSVYAMLADGSKKFPNNGYGGAVDPTPFCLQKDPPPMYTRYIVFHQPTGRMGVLVVGQSGFADAIVWAKDGAMLDELKRQFEVPANAPTINVP